LTAGNFKEAIECYSQAISLDAANHVLYSNRSAAYLKAGLFKEALADADKTIQLNEKWPKGYSRKGAVLYALEKYDEASTCYNKGTIIFLT
jgi:stress-induced-phosphoprotein 1